MSFASPTTRLPFLIGTAVAGLLAVLAAVMPATAAAQPAPTLLESDAGVTSVACPAIGDCTAVGSYESTGGEPLGLLLTETGGLWAPSTEAVMPNGSSNDPNVNLAAVSCGSAGDCSAVGNYVDSSYNQQGVVINERSGTWHTGSKVFSPPGAAGNPEETMQAVSCPSAGNCGAVGDYVNQYGETSALVVNETKWDWSPVQTITLPAGATGTIGPSSSLDSISCTSAGNCTAVGWYTSDANAIEGLLLNEVNGVWQAGVEAVPPTPTAAQPNVSLSSVSCSAPGTCSAVGYYDDSLSNQQGMLLSEAGYVWSAGALPGLPGNAAGAQSTTLNSVACTGPGDCTAAGVYTDDAGNFQGLLLNQSGGVWAAGTEAVLPPGAAVSQKVALNSVACGAYETCVVAGTYFSNHPTALLLSETGGRWKHPIKGVMPADGAGDPFAAVNDLACAGTAYCIVAGQYVDAAGNSQGLVIEGDGLYWRAGLQASLPGGLVTAIKLHKKSRRTEARGPTKHRHALP